MNISTQELLDELTVVQKKLDKLRKNKVALEASTLNKIEKIDRERLDLRDRRDQIMEIFTR